MDDKQLKETFISGEDIYKGAIMHVQKWQVKLPDGRTAAREIVLHHGAAAIVPIDDKCNVTLVRQHRVAIDSFTWEIPAGKLDFASEDPFECAKRELKEETGFEAKHWKYLTRVVTTPGFCTERISLYLAMGLTKGETKLDKDEFLFCKTIPLKAAVQKVLEGEITDLKTCLGLLMADRILSDKASPIAQSTAIKDDFLYRC
ncbi:MAG: NUDIX hydrolase [Eubacteriales bacterium]|nr:NUDIX hydrolase [Eubacteriales bacterium]